MKRVKFEYRITVAYLLAGGLWIIFSDKFLNSIVEDPHLLTELQTYKGWFYVAITGVLFYYFLKRHLERLRKTEFEARESDRLKTAFLQNISHEIRTPMNGIIGFSELLESEDVPEKKKKEFLKVITRSSNQLLSIVNDVLDISLIETGNINVNKDVVNINELLEDLYATFQPLVKDEIKFSLQKELDDLSAIIITDIVKLRQVLYNLLNNANKFTDKGFIKFGYSLKNQNIEFYVEDSGIGIAPALQSKIFERFAKAEKNNFRLYDGIGLGLAICKGNVDLLGGKISVKSEENTGSRFSFTIPYSKVYQEEKFQKDIDSKLIKEKGITVLVVEDEESNFLYIKEILTHAKIRFVSATNGNEAVVACSKNKKISLVLMDLKMPEMNGYEALSEIKKIRPELPVVAQTAFALEEEKQKMLKSGFDGHISKPFKAEQLLKVLSNLKVV